MKTKLAVAAIALAVGMVPAFAGKDDDTLRMAFEYPISTVDAYADYKPEIEMLSQMVFDRLVAFEEESGEYKPMLATSWEQVNETTWRFNLREDVSWHDGEPFTADDIVYTLNWIIAPETQVRQKSEMSWLAEAVMVDDHTVELKTNGLTANILSLLSSGGHILPEHIHGPLEDKAEFRNNLVGTGMYEVTELTSDGQLTLSENEDYAMASDYWPAPSIGTVQIRAVPDIGAQTAALMSGDLDFVRNARFEEAQAIASSPDYEVTLSQSIAYIYMMLDTDGQSGQEALADPRVRQALIKAVDRNAVQTSRTGGQEPSRTVDHLCWDFQIDCAYNTPIPAYDPEGAKALLEEAGYGDGFSVTIHTFNSVKDFAEVVGGYLSQVGVDVEIIGQTFAAFRKSQADEEFQILLAAWNGGKGPDSMLAFQPFFNSDARDLLNDPEVTEINKAISSMNTGEERASMVAQVLDASVGQGYMIPMSGIPIVFLHKAELEMNGNRMLPYTVYLNDFTWAE
ncbi:ABC transporter substrate-binding protein [Maritimibacter sp. UBA3975]|uniref:ABC transporter substrate-binding protein n=1 Tax=Maritimibacter sp. UBA3975 TaxID=1946833 RepID=UPI0025BCF08F|nr:ABC transporter substrate-binding protein [Maritimibacter sp. UBA3975]